MEETESSGRTLKRMVGAERTARSASAAAPEIRKGRSFPLGATPYPDGVNFSVFSKNATGVELLFFDHVDDIRPARLIPIDPSSNRTYHYWPVFVPVAIRAVG